MKNKILISAMASLSLFLAACGGPSYDFSSERAFNKSIEAQVKAENIPQGIFLAKCLDFCMKNGLIQENGSFEKSKKILKEKLEGKSLREVLNIK